LMETKMKVIWSLPSDQRIYLTPSASKAFRVAASLPVLNIVKHSNVKVIISTCGLATVQESLYYGKPVLCIPMIGDQVDVASRLVSSGAGVRISQPEFWPEDVKKMISLLTSNSSYSQAARRMSRLLRSSGGVSEAVSFVEMAIYPGMGKLQLDVIEQSLHWHQKHGLDVVAVFVSAVCALVVLVRFIWGVMLLPMQYLKHSTANSSSNRLVSESL
jgi:hypothetical protein